MDEVGLKYHPVDMVIKSPDLTASLLGLQEFINRRRYLWYTVINERPLTSQWIEAALSTLRF